MSNHPIVQSVLADCARDPWLRQAFLTSPGPVLKSRGYALPAGVEVVALPDTDSLTHVVVPGTCSPELRARLDRPGHQVRYAQNLPHKVFIPVRQ